jgi:hypoxanthine phosphoribosyltransferase
LGFVPQPPAFRAFAGAAPPRFVNEVELECAKLFDYYGVPWEYEPRTFVLERDGHGRVTSAFTPDFYLPEQDMYVECTTMRQKLTSRKNRKLRKLREQGVLVTVLYRRDFQRLRERHGIPFEVAA